MFLDACEHVAVCTCQASRVLHRLVNPSKEFWTAISWSQTKAEHRRPFVWATS